MEAYGTTTFCDDIRFETRGKITLVGCYSGELNFSGPKPGLLPTFAALVNLQVPASVEFSKVEIRVLKDISDEVEVMFETTINVSKEDRQRVLAPRAGESQEEQDDKVLYFSMPLQWSPLEIPDEGFIKVRAFLDGEKEVKLGALKLNFKSDQD